MLQLRVDGIKWESPDTATFYLVEGCWRPVPYKAGQFITLVFNHHNQEVRRSYSLSSSPDDDRLAITVKRVSNGEISRFMLTKVNVGDVLNVANRLACLHRQKINPKKTSCFLQLEAV
jgi:ferredoxin-NADP reductase